MINHPSVNVLLTKVENKYALVSLVSRRARKIVEGDKSALDSETIKPVSQAVRELDEGKYKVLGR